MRGSGKTTKQMQEAPEDAWFVIRDSGMFSYAYNLQASLERQDLRIVVPRDIRPERLMGFEGEIVVDHAAYINGEQYEAIMQWTYRKMARND